MFRLVNPAHMLRAIPVLSIQPVTKPITPILRLKHTATGPQTLRTNTVIEAEENGVRDFNKGGEEEETGSSNKPPGVAEPFLYINNHGEEVLFGSQAPPRGYTLVYAGNPFVTRKCRRLAKETQQKIYAHRVNDGSTLFARHDGLYVPNAIAEKALSEFDAKKAKADKKWLQKLDKMYPHIPSEDKTALERICSTSYTLSHKDIERNARDYLRDRYRYKPIPFRKKASFAAKASFLAAADKKVDRILLSWRVKDPGNEVSGV